MSPSILQDSDNVAFPRHPSLALRPSTTGRAGFSVLPVRLHHDIHPALRHLLSLLSPLSSTAQPGDLHLSLREGAMPGDIACCEKRGAATGIQRGRPGMLLHIMHRAAHATEDHPGPPPGAGKRRETLCPRSVSCRA